MSTFQATLTEQLQAVPRPAPTSTLPLEVWALDEARFGLQTVRRRRLTLRGVKPSGPYQHAFTNFYAYGAVNPRTGDGYFHARVALNSTEFQVFLNEFAAAHPTTFNVLLLDNARAHRAADLQLPANVAWLFQPPYAPELNPCERIWLAFKDGLAWRCFADVLALQDQLIARSDSFDAAAFQSLIAYPYLMAAIHALSA